MPRICGREDCGKRLVGKNGSPDFRKHFCSAECSRADRREKMQAKRAKLKTGRCPTCGYEPIANQLSDAPVRPHEAPTSVELGADEGEVRNGT